MKTNPLKFSGQIAVVLLALISPTDGVAAVRHVNASNATPASPYTNWVTAATTIQAALDIAADGDMVLVTNGVYQSGSRVDVASGAMNRIVATNAVNIQSVNGPAVT